MNTSSFLDFLISKGYTDENGVINVETLTGSKQALGNGTGLNDVYKIEKEENNIILNYYDVDSEKEELWQVSESSTEQGEDVSYNEELKTLKQGDYVIYDTGIEGVGEIVCRVLYDANSEYGLQIVTDDCIKQNGEYVRLTLEGKDDYNNAIEILNGEAEKYKNEDYVVDARCIGSNPEDKTEEAVGFVNYNGSITDIKDGDNNWEADVDTLNNLNIYRTKYMDEEDIYYYKGYWMASREIEIRKCLCWNCGTRRTFSRWNILLR